MRQRLAAALAVLFLIMAFVDSHSFFHVVIDLLGVIGAAWLGLGDFSNENNNRVRR